MADQSTPKRSSRGRVLAVIALLLIAIIAWRASTNSDQRFVGNWVAEHTNGKSRWKLNDDGTGHWCDQQGRVIGIMNWTVNDDVFITMPLPRETGLKYWKVLARQWYYVAMGDGASGRQSHRFTQSSPDSFELDFQPQGDELDQDNWRLVRDFEPHLAPSP